MRCLLAALLLLTACGSGSSGTDTALPDPPDGTRWVGHDGVVVAVADWWSTGETQCLAPVEDTVYFDSGAMADCPDPADPATVREVSALAVLDGSSGYGEKLLGEMEPVGGGILERPGCEEWFPGVCRRVFALEGTDVVFALTIVGSEDGDHDAIRDSVRPLPAGFTTVPIAVGQFPRTPAWGDRPAVAKEYIAALEAAGLSAEVTYLDVERGGVGDPASFPRGHLLEVDPTPGTPIEEGGTVAITLMGENPYSHEVE